MQARPQLLALAGRALVVERGEHADDRQHRVRGVAHAEAVVERLVAVGHRARLVLEAGRRLVQRVEAAEVPERTLEPVRVRVAVDDVGLHRSTRLVVEVEPAGRPLRHVVVDDVGRRHELHRDLVTLGRLDVERDVALAALAPEERGGRHAHAVAGDRLDLDDVGPQVADDHRPERTGEVLAEVDQPDAFERVHQTPPRRSPRRRRVTEASTAALRVPERTPDLVVVLADAGLRTGDRARRPQEVDRHADLRRRAEVGVDDGRHHVVRDQLRVRELLLGRDDRLDRVVVRDQLGDHFVALAVSGTPRATGRRACSRPPSAGARRTHRVGERLDAHDVVERLERRETAHHRDVHELVVRALEDHRLVDAGRVRLRHQA